MTGADYSHSSAMIQKLAPTFRRSAFLALLSLIALLTFAPGCSRYDELVNKDQIAAEKWSNLDASLQRRYDLVPNLVATVKALSERSQAESW